MNRLPILLAVLSFCIWPASLNAVLTFTFSPNGDTDATILTLSGYSRITSNDFEVYDYDGVWDYLNNDGKPLHLNEWLAHLLKITMCGVEPQGGFEITMYDRSAVSTTGGDGFHLSYYWGLVEGCRLEGSGSIPLDDLLFSKFNPGGGKAKTPVNAPFAIVVEDGNGPISPVPEPAGLITFMAVLLITYTVWRKSLN